MTTNEPPAAHELALDILRLTLTDVRNGIKLTERRLGIALANDDTASADYLKGTLQRYLTDKAQLEESITVLELDADISRIMREQNVTYHTARHVAVSTRRLEAHRVAAKAKDTRP